MTETINLHIDSQLKRMRERSQTTTPPPVIVDEKKYIVLDIETTGFNPKKDRITEIAAVRIDTDGNKLGVWQQLFHVEHVPIKVQQITNITTEMLVRAPRIEEMAQSFRDFIQESVLIGHNIDKFDIKFLDHYGLTRRHSTIDTLDLARKSLPQSENHKLGTLCEYFSIDHQSAHRALGDAYATIELYKHLTNK